MPRLPDVEARRADFDIVSFAVEPGDVVVFHPAILHGGAATRPGTRRRTLSLRFFGEDATYAARPGMTQVVVGEAEATNVFQLLPATLSPGDPFRHPGFPKVRPR
jgi:ectoine hydroxylase-related dioxygenase (phytanoyl-CoA dioxygenase family)